MISKSLKVVHLLSFDVAIGAAICQRFFSKILDIQLSWIPGALLGICVLLIYNVDHLIDSITGDAVTARRQFYRDNRKGIAGFCVLLLIVGAVLMVQLNRETLQAGIVLLLVCSGYLVLIFFVPGLWFKEVVVAIFYCVGVVLAPISVTSNVSYEFMYLAGQFAMLAFVNLLLFSVYDLQNDQSVGFSSLVTRFGKSAVLNLVYGILGILVLSVLVEVQSSGNQLIILAMTLLLIALTAFRSRFAQNDLYRVIGDAVFFIPIVGLL